MSASFTDVYARALHNISNGISLSTIEANVLAAVSTQLTIAALSIPEPPPPTQEELVEGELNEAIHEFLPGFDVVELDTDESFMEYEYRTTVGQRN